MHKIWKMENAIPEEQIVMVKQFYVAWMKYHYHIWVSFILSSDI